jgi:S1-C subfamily serine protease/thiol-disulfide isomerase/thioredoxin
MKVLSSKRCLILLLIWQVFFWGAAGSNALSQERDADYRTWTDTTGKFQVVARLVTVENGTVQLELEDGRIVEVPAQRLSDGDCQFVARREGASENPFARRSPPPLETIVREVEDAIVFITSRDHFGTSGGLGSGFVIDRSGLVATNYHVVQNASSVAVKFKNGTEVAVAGYRALDKQRDLAILELEEPPPDLATLPLAASSDLKQGDGIIAFGHPQGFEFSVSDGIVSALRRTSELPQPLQANLGADPACLWIQISAPLTWGNSGGPLLDTRGRLVGVNTWIAVGQGIGFAVHAQHLDDLREQMLEEPRAFPVPGSLLGPGVTDPLVLEQLGDFPIDLQDFLRKLFSVEDASIRAAIAASESPVPKYVARLRRTAQNHAGSAAAYQALVTVTRLVNLEAKIAESAFGGSVSDRSRDSLARALSCLQEDHVEAPSLGGLVFELAALSTPELHEFQRAIVTQNPSREVSGATCLALALSLLQNPRTRGRSEQEAIEALTLACDEYGDVEIGDTTLKELADPDLREVASLSVGRTPRNICGVDSQGREFQLKDYAGKVILLDFWVDWCPTCRGMYTQERRLVAKHAPQSFVILGINCDELPRLRNVEASGKVTWRSWADGRDGSIASQWNIQAYPTLFLLDYQGRIRFKFAGRPHPDQLAARIESLLQEREMQLAFDLVEPCSVWNYLDDGTAPDPTWLTPEFDDSTWCSGRAPLGQGWGDEATTVQLPRDPQEKLTTTYFRKRFTVAERPKPGRVLLSVTFNDGVAVYLNGREVMRENLGPESGHGDPAINRCLDRGLRPRIVELDPDLLEAGDNLVAVEVHAYDHNEDDLLFDLSLSSSAASLSRP